MKVSTWDATPTRRDGVWLRQAGEENAVFEPASGSVYLMNETALAIWDLCDGRTTAGEMIDAVCEVSGMHAEVVQEDVGRILDEFERAGLITWGGQGEVTGGGGTAEGPR